MLSGEKRLIRLLALLQSSLLQAGMVGEGAAEWSFSSLGIPNLLRSEWEKFLEVMTCCNAWGEWRICKSETRAGKKLPNWRATLLTLNRIWQRLWWRNWRNNSSNYLFPMLASGLPWTLCSDQNMGSAALWASCRITNWLSEIYSQ